MSKKKDRKTREKDLAPSRQGKSEEKKLSRKEYEAALYDLQAELVRLQYWVVEHGHRAVIVFEGRDAAGKGGAIKRITERVSPRVFRTVALPAPSDREKGQIHGQRYLSQFPTRGEIVLFDRSWYNRAGVERVMNFSREDEVERFLETVPIFERMFVEGDVQLIKYWFDVSMEEQERRFRQRITDPRKTWKLSPMDIESYRRWYEYSRARDAMLAATDTDIAPWHIVQADNKRRARLNCISHLLSQFPYDSVPRKKVHLGKRRMKGKYDDLASLKGRRFIPEVF
jgi:polyphosphate kinase 2